ncbi:probable E3 ubiquitin-protein ligase MARCH10 isoform X2 [Fukomys damarensis]|uniref:probable E3 ubiquitin-protein ligase MARCH10 isoform X2 n=1 Tax=Fukomys damarensis TaxID=885580 RepID=UPI00053F898B|nr:probable E3 ubiquitin-protein ligase MARCH10 isoform X2 [Fukomys damarensis]
MMHEARDRQKFFSDVQYLRDMQHKMDFEYQACLRRQENRRDEKKRDQFCGQETGSERSLFSSKASSKQSSGGEESLTEPRPSSRKSEIKCDSKLPAIDQTPVKQKHKSTMSPRKPEQVGPSKTSPGDSREHPLFGVEYSPFCSVFAFSPVLQPSINYCCLLLPLVPPASPASQGSYPNLPSVIFPTMSSPASACPDPVPGSPASLCYFPISCPTPSETPVLCLSGPRRPSKIYLVW